MSSTIFILHNLRIHCGNRKQFEILKGCLEAQQISENVMKGNDGTGHTYNLLYVEFPFVLKLHTIEFSEFPFEIQRTLRPND